MSKEIAKQVPKGFGRVEIDDSGAMVPVGKVPLPVPMSDAEVRRIVEVWLKSVSPGSCRTYGIIIRRFFAWMHLSRAVGVMDKQAVNGEILVDWDGIIRADVVRELNATEIKDFLAERQNSPIKFIRKGRVMKGNPIGLRRAKLELSAIRSLTKELYLANIISGNQLKHIELIKLTARSTPKGPGFVEVEVYEAVLEDIKPQRSSDLLRCLRDRCIIILAFRYWLRKSELQNLRVGDFKREPVKDNGELGTAYVLEWLSKGDKPRKVWLTPDVAEPLIIWLRESGLENVDPKSYLFPSFFKGGGFRTEVGDARKVAMCVALDSVIEARFDELYLKKKWRRPGERSGITLHSLRRGGMRAAKRAGCDILDVSWDAGHTSLDVTMQYLGQRGFEVRHSSEFIKAHEIKTEDWVSEQRKRLAEESKKTEKE